MKRLIRLGAFLVLATLTASAAPDKTPADGSILGDILVADYPLLVGLAGFSPARLDNHSIGQSHIDAAWRWRIAQTHTKVYHTFSQAVDKMERHPGFVFSQSQPALYEWMLDEHPDLFAEIQAMEKKGQWEITGGMWVEPDCNMPDGESFVRQFLLGQRFYIEHFRHPATVAWIPDSFGYNRNLPQFISGSQAKYLWAKKLTTNFDTVFPFQNFRWRAPDGSEILANNGSSVGYPLSFPLLETTMFKPGRYLLKPGAQTVFDYATSPQAIKSALSRDWTFEIPIYYGVGDGGMGPQEREVVFQEKMISKKYSRFSTSLEFFKDLEKYLDRLPVWDDEMYLERHRGVQTTHSWIKRANRLSEQMLRTAETLRAIESLYGISYPYQALKDIWKIVCINQFHDILPGSSIPEVYEDAKKDYDLVRASGLAITRAGLEELARLATVNPPAPNLQAVLVFNPLAWTRSGLVKLELPDQKRFQVIDKNGGELVSQVIFENGKSILAFRAEDVPAVGYKTCFLKPVPETDAGKASGDLKISDSREKITLENEYLAVAIDKKQGWIISLVDKQSGKELIDGSANKLLAFFDRHKVHRAWNIDPDYYKHPIPLPAASEVKISQQGPLMVEAQVRREYQDDEATTFDQRVRLVAGDPVVYLEMDSDFHIQNALVKIEFNTVLNGATVAADGPYLVVERPTHPQTPAARARWEMVCHKWIDLSDRSLGLALLNNGKYGFSLNDTGTGFRQTVIKAAEFPQAYADAENVNHYEKQPLPYTDQGPQHLELGLLVHRGGWREAKLWKAGYDFNTPLEAVRTGAHPGQLPAEASFLTIESESAYITAIKRAEDDNDLVVRVVETEGRKAPVTLKLGQGLKIISAEETDLIELNPRKIPGAGSTLSFDISPFQIKTLKLSLERQR